MEEKPRVLIIEDDATVQMVLRHAFEKDGFAVTMAMDGMQGPLLARKVEPHLIVLDLLLPAGGGMSVLERLRQIERFSRTPVLIYSVKPRDVVLSAVKEDAITRILTKPTQPEVIIDTARELLAGPK